MTDLPSIVQDNVPLTDQGSQAVVRLFPLVLDAHDHLGPDTLDPHLHLDRLNVLCVVGMVILVTSVPTRRLLPHFVSGGIISHFYKNSFYKNYQYLINVAFS